MESHGGKIVTEENRKRIFIASAGFERATLGSSDKHTNHYTTEAIARHVEFCIMYLPESVIF
jgi:hypothetical protein